MYFDTEQELIDENARYQSNRDAYDGEMIGGIVFEPGFEYGFDSSTPDLDYTIRMSPEFVETGTNLLFPVFQTTGPGYGGERRAI